MEPFENPERIPIRLLHHDGHSADAIVISGDDPYRLLLEFRGESYYETAEDTFEAFGKIRDRLELIGYRPICYGACLNYYPSPMSRDMGGGVKLYRFTLGERTKANELFFIFDTEPGLAPVTFAEQNAFYVRWLDSIGV